MKEKLKDILRSASRKKAPSDHGDDPGDARPTSSARAGRSIEEHRSRQSGNTHGAIANDTGRDRPLGFAHDSRGSPGLIPNGNAQVSSSTLANDPIANDYRAYMSGLSDVDRATHEADMPIEGDGEWTTREGERRHQEGVVDRSDQKRASLEISKRKALPATPGMSIDEPAILSEAVAAIQAKNSVNGLAALDATDEEMGDAGVGTGGTKHVGALPLRPKNRLGADSTSARVPDHIKKEMKAHLDGVVDLRNTLDTDKDVKVAPAVVHEVVKRHEHEIIQHKLFREIHNYEHYHRIQPVYDLEILPPRHWIPNPNGDGLIEVSADELPSRTGNNRRWKIVLEETELSKQPPKPWRTEPQIIEHPTTVTAEGFERKETTIIHPPTLADLTDYTGLVQPVHFDHKTGKRWLSPVCSMHQLRKDMGAVADPDHSSDGLPDNIPRTPGVTELPPPVSHSPDLKRKPVPGHEPGHRGSSLENHGSVGVAV